MCCLKITLNCSYSLEESGQTALGPAALVSVVIASQKPGSRVRDECRSLITSFRWFCVQMDWLMLVLEVLIVCFN